MKRLLPLILVLGLVMLGACKEKKQSEDIITTKYEPKRPMPPIPMQPVKQVVPVSWGTSLYNIVVEQTPVDSLPMVTDENGQKYIDNRVVLTISHKDGSNFFTRTYTKASFSNYIDETFRKNGILASFRFDDIDEGRLKFSVVIALPDAIDDVFIPLKYTVDRQAAVSISRDEDLDILGYDNYDENEDDDDGTDD